MRFIKVHDNGFTEYLINTSHITYIANDGRKTSIGLDDKTFLCVSESPEEILEVLKEADPLSSKLLAQTDKIDNILDNMEKKDPWTELMRRFMEDKDEN